MFTPDTFCSLVLIRLEVDTPAAEIENFQGHFQYSSKIH